ncbi:unnamed protein product [Rodentolepis nana]|uniref:GCS light chain n=1 Tax=Rodentolepis nana TaxID=102285 RepID=A0A0R3T256_RODNA|nr:unnamed protein product [Rodentolepis nana]
MAEIPKAQKLFLHTSNILKWNNVQLIKNPFDEVETCIKTVMHCWHSCNKNNLKGKDSLCIACDKHRDRIPVWERTLDRLGLDDMETLVVSLSPELSRGAIVDHPPCMGNTWARIPQNTAQSLLKIWPILEEFVEANKIFRLGVSDMPVSEMEALCSSVKIPPKVNQVFIGSTCLMSEELENFAKQHDIQLLTHHDSAGMLSLPLQKINIQTIVINLFSTFVG